MGDRGLVWAFYPLYITHFLMGHPPFKLSKSRINDNVSKKLYNIFALIVIVLLILVYVVYRHQSVVNNPDLNHSALIKFINMVYFAVVLGFTLVSYIWSAIQRTHTVKLWKKIIKIDNDMKSVGIRPNYTYISRSSLRFLFCSLISLHTYILYLLFSQEFHDKLQAFTSYGLLYFGVLNHTAVTCSFVTLMRFVNHILDVLIKKTESVLANPDVRCDHHLRRIMCVYHRLFEISKLISQTFSVQLLLSFGISFVMLTFQSYNVICSAYNGSPHLKYAFAGIIFVLMGVFEKFVIVVTCHKCMNQVSKVFGNLVC